MEESRVWPGLWRRRTASWCGQTPISVKVKHREIEHTVRRATARI
jgi:hypothetical protein